MCGLNPSRDGVGLRCAVSEDESFLRNVFASTRVEELALTGWNDQQKDAFLRMQFDAQRRSYANDHPAVENWVIQHHGVDVGRMITHRSASRIALMDIAVLPEYRNRGIASVLLRELMEEAAPAGKSIRLHVERFNPALHWYQRLGFEVVGEGQIYLEMIWQAGSDGSCGSGVGLEEIRIGRRGLERQWQSS